MAVAALVSTVGASAAGAAEQARAGGPPMVLIAQTPWVTADQPWFNLSLGISPNEGAAASLQVNLTFYGRMGDISQLQQATTGTPTAEVLLRLTEPVTAGAGGLEAAACVPVARDSGDDIPTTGTGACAPGARTLTLDCTPLSGKCGDVYPVSVALVRQGSSTPLERFTTFLTYEEPSAVSATGGALRVGVVLPVTAGGTTTVADALTDHHDVAATLAVNPSTVSAIEATRSRPGLRALDQVAALSGDQTIDQPFVPINVAALSEAGIANEIGAQMARGTTCCTAPSSNRTAGPGWTPPRRSRRVTPATSPRACRWPGRPRRSSATTTWPRAA